MLHIIWYFLGLLFGITFLSLFFTALSWVMGLLIVFADYVSRKLFHKALL